MIVSKVRSITEIEDYFLYLYMIESIITESLTSLNESEIRSFGKFIRSPYFNESPVMIKLFEIMRKYYPAFTNRNFTKPKIFKKLYPAKKYNDDTMRKHLSDLQKLIEDYFSHSYLDSNKFNKKMYLVEKLEDKNLSAQFMRRLKEMEEEYINDEKLCEEYFDRSFALSTRKWNHIIGAGEAGQYNQHNEVVGTHLERLGYFLTGAIINLLKMNQDSISISRFYSLDRYSAVTTKFLESVKLKEFLAEYKALQPDFYPIVMIYYYNYIILNGDEKGNISADYQELKKLVVENMDKFTDHEKKIHMLFLENGCLAAIRQGRKEFMSELHSIYNIMLSEKLYVYRESDHMTTSRFIKIVQNAADIMEYKWAGNFIEEYSLKLPLETISDIKNYSYALLCYAKDEYEKAIEHSSKVKFLASNINIQSKILKLKSCYEMKYMDEILYQLNSYGKTLQNDIISPLPAKEKFHAFMQMLGKITRLSFKPNKAKTESLLIELEGEENIYEKQWLTEKLLEIKNS